MMEKGRPTYNLESIKESFSSVERLRMTRTARRSAVELGLRASDIIEVIQSLRQADFYKSMTTYADHRLWQDVYHGKCRHLSLYIKFMLDLKGYLIVSFKEK